MATNITFMHALGYYLERIRIFLEGNKKTISFPNISTQLENALVKIVTDNTDFLHDDQYNEKVKMEAVNLTATLKTYVNTFKLIHEYVEKGGQRVLMYRKEPLDKFTIPKPMRKPREVQASSTSPADEVVTTAFKTRCLNNTTKFVKDDSCLIMRYPELSADEAEFVMGMLMQGQQGSTQLMDVGYGFRSIYAPLWESMRLFTSKYHYEIKSECCSTRAGGKTVIFEKIPKRVKPSEKMDVEIIPTVPNNKTSSETSSPFTSRSSSPVASVTKQKNIKVVNKVKNASILVRRLRKYIAAQNITNEFVENTLQAIENFVSKQEEASLILDRINLQQLYFLDNVNRICNSDFAYMLFTSQSQLYLNNIKYYLSNNIKYAVSTSKYAGQKMLRQVVFTKLAVFSKNTGEKPVTALKTVTNEKDVTLIKQTVATNKPAAKIQTETKVTNENHIAVIKQTVAAKNPEVKIQTDQAKVAKEKDVTVINKTVAAKNPEVKMQADQTKVAKDVEKPNTEVLVPYLSSKARKNLERLKVVIDKVTQAKGESFLQNTLQQYSEFLSKTNEEVCLFYDKATPEEHWFLEKAHEWSTMDAVYPLFSRECQQLLSSIKTRAKNYELDFAASNVPSGDASSEKYFFITMSKLPLYKNGSQKKSKRAKSLSANMRAKTETASSVTVNSARGTSTQPPALPRAKAKLIEGLAQPVQSEKATRMMQSMGWTGGALGRRGTGITEPIAPSLDLSIRAGFGAPKPEPKSAKVKAKAKQPTPPSQSSTGKLIQAGTPQANTAQANSAQANSAQGCEPDQIKTVMLEEDYRLATLKCVLELITTGIDAIQLVLITLKAKKAKVISFVKHVVIMYNNRNSLGLGKPDWKSHEAAVIQELKENPEIKFKATVVKEQSIVLYKMPSAWTNNNSINKNMNVTTAPKVDSRTNNKTTSQKLSNADVNAKNQTQNMTYIDLTVDDIEIGRNIDGTSSVKMVNTDTGKNTDAGNHVLKENTIKNILKPSDNANIIDDHKNKTNIIAATKNNKTVIVDATDNKNANNKIVQTTDSGTEIVIDFSIPGDEVVRADSKTIIPKKIETSNDNIQADIIQSDNENITENLKINDINKNKVANYDDHGVKVILDNTECLEIDSEADNRLLVSDVGTETRNISINVAIEKADSDGCKNVLDALKNVMTDDACNAEKVERANLYSENQDSDQEPRSNFRKRVSTGSINSKLTTKKCKPVDFKKLCILHKNYPQIKINSEKAREIQTSILKATDFTNLDLLPVLTCQGIQNDSLVYICHDENSLSFMEDWIKTMAEYKIVYEVEAKENLDHKMAFKINSYIDESVDRILNRLELYNSGLNTTTWSFIKKEQYSDFIVIYVELDDISFRYVCDANFILPAGNDCARFTIVWD